MLNVTNTCLYQACTNITTYRHNICVSTKYQLVPCINLYHQPCMKKSASTMCQTCITASESTMHQTYITKMASTMHQHLYQTMHQPSTIYINMYQSYTISCHSPNTNKPRYESTMYLSKKNSMNMYHASNDVP
jgi:hypothetical protein